MERIRVLVVDDASFMRDMMKKSLRAGFPGFKVEEAINGRQARQMLEKSTFDLVMCDWEMPEMSGAEVLEWIRANPDTADLPFVMVTSRGEKAHVLKAVELKANNYIVKPYTTEKLIKVVGGVLAKAKGISVDELRGAGAREATGRDVGLSGAIPVAATLGDEAHSEAPAEAPRKRTNSVRVRGKVVVQLRFSDVTVPCLLKEVSLDHIEGVIRRDAKLPGILDLTVLDLQQGEEVARLNGFIHTLQARDDSRETEFVNITIGLVDSDDPQKMAFMGHYMASLA